MSTSPTLDSITLEILFNALRSVTDETYIALMRSAYSTNIKERRDHSTAICDVRGGLIVQAENSLPIHLASMIGLMKCLLLKYPLNEIEDGDLFIANDPHVAGGTHLPDVNMAMPVFSEGEIIAFVCNIAHHADIGGMAPGSMAGGMSEIYQEGLRIPVLKLFRKGELQQDLLDLILLNVRLPEERRGDYYAQIASCRLGARRLAEITDAYGNDVVCVAFKDIVVRTERRMRAAIETIPDGEYIFEDVMDDDGLGAIDIPIKLRIEKSGDQIHFDFTGTSPQVLGNINLTDNATQASV
ncbi:hydantoinase B/oxoprolinase family protein, partial [Alphaproteobacteria bacterium]|nr:hydantoinase B/oxoprolinase family protein [Alphaproteobacteria bacterium]